MGRDQPTSLEVQFTARKSQRREAYTCAPQRLRDAAQRRKWAFCGTGKIDNGVAMGLKMAIRPRSAMDGRKAADRLGKNPLPGCTTPWGAQRF